jgi:hypothetical protein
MRPREINMVKKDEMHKYTMEEDEEKRKKKYTMKEKCEERHPEKGIKQEDKRKEHSKR